MGRRTNNATIATEMPTRRSHQRIVKRHTAWTIAADWWWLDKYAPRIVGGRKLWEVATIPERGSQKRVRLWRLEGLKEFTRWVKPETRMELVLLNDQAQRPLADSDAGRKGNREKIQD